MGNIAQENEKSISGAIKVDEKEVMEHLDGLVRKFVEDTLNTLLNEEADAIGNAGQYQRSPDCQDIRAGTYKRTLSCNPGVLISSGIPKKASAMLPAMAAMMSLSPPMLTAFLTASSKESASRKETMSCGTEPSQDKSP